MVDTTFKEHCYWNTNSYGSATKIKRSTILVIVTVICIVTPFTNWLIPIAPKCIKKDIVLRYD